MRNNIIAIVAAFALLAGACTVVQPEPGFQAVLVERPMFFGTGGVVDTTVMPGRSYTWFSTSPIYVSTVPQQNTIHINDLMSSDGVPLDFDAAMRYRIVNPVSLVKDFGDKWFESNMQVELLNRIRQAVRKHGMNETAISTKAIDEIDREITEGVTAYIASSKLPIELIQITVGRANPPDSIKSQRVETATQQQRQLTEQQRKLAEDQRKDAEASRAKADNAYREAMNLSPDQFLQLERIKAQKEICLKAACTFFIGDEPVRTLNLR